MTKLAFVTGAVGFIGSYTSRVLADAGWKVVGIGIGFNGDSSILRSAGISYWEERYITLDELCSLARVTGAPDAVIHCAGSGSVPYSLQNPYKDFLGNVNTTLDVLEFCRLQPRKIRIVIPSSAAVYGAVSEMPIAEDCPRCPVSPYGTHKVMVEELCRSYAKNWELPISVIRLFSIYGNGLRKQLLWDACKKAYEDRFSFFGSGNEIRDWLHVCDAARLLMSAIDFASPKCPVINGGTGVGITIREVVDYIGKLWNPHRIPVFSGQVKAGDPAHYIADCTQLADLGFTPHVPFEKGLSSYVKWFRTIQE